MNDVQSDFVVAGQDHFRGDGVVRREEVPVGGLRTLVYLIRTLVDEPLGRLDAFVQVLLVTGYAVVFAECAFEKTDPRLEGEGGPLRDAVNVLFLRQFVDGVVDVLENLGHDQFAGVAGLV